MPLRTILMRFLTHEHHTCFEAANGLEAFTMVKRTLIARPASHAVLSDASVVYDLIIMDRNMPEMSGIEAAVAIRKAGYKGPIIGVSGDIDNGDFVAAGATLVMEKPVPFDEMKKTIAKVMQASHETTNSINNSGLVAPTSQRLAVRRKLSQTRDFVSRLTTRRVAPAHVYVPAYGHSATAATAGAPGHASIPAPVSVVMPQAAVVVSRAVGSAANSGRGAVTPGHSQFASDTHVVMGWEKIFSLTLSFIDPRFNTAEMRSAFVEYRRSGLNHKLMAALSAVSLAIFTTRGSLATLWRLNPTYPVAFLGYLVGSLCITTSVVNRLAVISYRFDIKLLQPYHAAAVALATSRFAVAFESAALVCMTMCTGMYVLARTLQGPCPPHTTIWDEQQCNPDASSHNIPQEAFVSAIVNIFGFQVFINSASKRSVAASWVILLALVNASMVVVGSSLLVWNNLLLVCAMCVSYEFER